MMKKTIAKLSLALTLVFYGFILQAQTVTIGTRSGSGNSGVLLATNSGANVDYSRAAAIYTATEILNAGGYAGEITKLWWSKEGTGEYTFGDAKIKIYLRHTNAAVNTDTKNLWVDKLNGDTVLVFESTTWNIPTGTGWKQVTFTNKFVWDGIRNVEVLVQFHRPTNLTTAISWASSTATDANAVRVSGISSGFYPGYPDTIHKNNTRPIIQFEIVDPLANDASVKIITPPVTRAAGLDSVSLEVTNRGGTMLYNVDLNWEVDGVLQTGLAKTFPQPLLTGESSAVIKMGNYNFTPGNHFIRVWSSSPNSTTDNNRLNDTASMNIWVPFAPLSGVYTIDPSQVPTATNFRTFTDAFRAVNESGISGTVYFDVAANSVFNESTLLLTATGTATDSIVFRKSGTGNNPLLVARTGTSTSRDYIIGLEGSDYVVFDGIDLSDTDPVNSTTTHFFEWGYVFFRKSATDGAQHNVIRNSRIELRQTHSAGVGIYSINTTGPVAGSSTIHASTLSGTNSYNHIHNNTIINCNTGISIKSGALASGMYDESVQIGTRGGNTITRFGGGTSSSDGGINIENQNNTVIANNIIQSLPTSGITLRGINLGTGINSSATVNSNTVTIRTTSSSASYAILNGMGATGTNNTITISNNTITGCYLTGAEFNAIRNAVNVITVNISGNLIENDSTNSSSSFYGIYNNFSGTGPVCTANIFNNTFSNIKRNLVGTTQVTGIYAGSTTQGCISNVYGNTFNGISGLFSGTSSNNTVSGIFLTGSSFANVYKNTFKNIYTSGNAGRATGIHFFSSSSNGLAVRIYNNYISNITAPASTDANATSGMYIDPSANSAQCSTSVYYNTIYLDDVPTATTYGSAGIYAKGDVPLDMRNNIIINKSLPGSASGIAAAYKRGAVTLASYSDSSNNNVFFTGGTVPTDRRYIFHDGTDYALTIGEFKNKMATRDQASMGIQPQFINTSTLPYDLHIDASVATPVESSGKPITLPTPITVDFDGDIRHASTPDIGADEGTFIKADLEGPSISFVALGNTSSLGNRTLEVTISDPSGVDSSAGGKPLLYYRKPFQSFISAPAISRSGNVFTFEINTVPIGGLNFNDVVEYYIAAQDLTGTTNMATFPEGGSGIFPPGSFAPANFASFSVLQPLSGPYYIGSTPHFPAPSYATLKDALADYGVKGIAGPVEFILVDTLYSVATNEIFPIIVPSNPDASSANTLTIKPETGVHVVIEGMAAIGSSIIKMNGSDYVIIDGLNRNGSSLKIVNTASVPDKNGMSAVVWISTNGADNGANYNIIKNTTILGMSATSTQAAIYSGSAIGIGLGQFTEANNNYNTIDSNTISGAYFGVLMVGSSIGNPAIGNRISNNNLGEGFRGFGLRLVGVQLNRQDSSIVLSNTIHNIYGNEVGTTDGDRIGINLLNSRNAIVRSNKIYDITFEGNNGTLEVRGINTAALAYKTQALPSQNEFSNNLIYNLSTTYYAVNVSVAGINLSDGYGDKAYFNTVHLTGQMGTASGLGSSAAMSFGYTSVSGNTFSAGTNMDVRNNIFSMAGHFVTSTTKKLYVYISKGTTLTGSTFDKNIIYANGSQTGNGIGKLGATDYNTLTAWQAVAGEANSLAVDPLLNGPLLPLPYTSSPAINAGVPISGITTDVYGVTRNATTPTIGAIETGGDFRKPDITIRPIRNTISTSNLTTTGLAVITDNSGVNLTAGTKPRLYFKRSTDLNEYNGNTASDNGWKWVETFSTDTPFNFIINYSLLSSVNTNDVIQYFVMAQDNAPVTNVASSAILNNPSASVNLSAANFPVTDFGSYLILPPTSGYVYVGINETYKSLTADQGLFDALKNSMILSGDITVIINSDLLTETGTHDLSSWQEIGTGNYKITFRPDQYSYTLRTISGNVPDGLIRLNGAKKISFNGMDTIAGYGKYLKFANTSGSVFTWNNNAQYDTITQCIIEGGSNTTTSGLIHLGPNGVRFNSINHNNITSITGTGTRYANAIYVTGTSPNPNGNNSIIYNNISNYSENGVVISSTGSGAEWNIVGNHFYDSAAGVATSAQTAISISAGANCRVDSNYIGGSTIFAGGNKWINHGNTAFEGIVANVNTNSTVRHNIITNIARGEKGTSASFSGLRISGGSALVENNVIGDSVNARSIVLCGATVHAGIEVTLGAANVRNNYVANIVTDSAVNTRLRGMSITSSGVVNVNNNRIFHLYTNSNGAGASAGSQAVTGIFASGGTTFSNNLIHHIVATRNEAGTATVAAGLVMNKAGIEISANRVYAIRNLAPRNPSAPATVAGIMFWALSSNVQVANNMIALGHDTTDHIRYIGIWAYSNVTNTTPINIVHNSISLFGTTTDTVPSYIILRGTGAGLSSVNTAISALNNIFHSTRLGARIYAIGNMSSSPATNWGGQRWNNNMYDMTGGINFGLWGSITVNNLADWKVTSLRDTASIVHTPFFTSYKDADHHLTGSSLGDLNFAGGTNTGVTNDFDGEARNVIPYIGADENTGAPVPVKLVSFNANAMNNDVLVSWTTAGEKNASHFIVQASSDGKRFETVTEQQAKGNSSSPVNYKFTHSNARKAMNANNVIYYRLTSVDKDGSKQESPVVMVRFDEKENVLDKAIAFPNPFSENISLIIPATEEAPAEILVIDLHGRTILNVPHQLVKGNNEINLNKLNDIDNGIYFIKVSSNGSSKVIKVVKN